MRWWWRGPGPRGLLPAVLAGLAAAASAAATPGPAAPRTPTYNGAVAALLNRHCVGCHRAGGAAAALPLTDYASTVGLAARIRSQVVARTMPPWPADSTHSLPLRDDPSLSDVEIATIAAWVDGGTPAGEGRAPPLPRAPDGWAHPSGRPPDAVVTLPEFAVKATGEIPYIDLKVRVPFTGDRWLAGLQVLPGSRALVHHMGIAEVEYANGLSAADAERLEAIAAQMGMPAGAVARTAPAVTDPATPGNYDMLAAYTPGVAYEGFAPGEGKLVRGGPDRFINFNIHYTTTGKPEVDRSRLGLWFLPKAPATQLFRVPSAGRTLIANGTELLADDPGTKAEGTDVAIPPVPPFADHYELTGITGYPRPVTLYAFQPHAHFRGRDFRYSLVYPDGREQLVLDVPRYDFRWQLGYRLVTPLRVPAGSTLVVTAHYDNSAGNAHLNEVAAADPARRCGPEKQAYFRDQNQSWDEMFSPLVEYSNDPLPASGAVPVVEAVGCLAPDGAGVVLQRALLRSMQSSQSTTRAELGAAQDTPPGSASVPLVGTRPFRPEALIGRRVAVKGLLTGTDSAPRLTVTSLQPVGGRCD